MSAVRLLRALFRVQATVSESVESHQESPMTTGRERERDCVDSTVWCVRKRWAHRCEWCCQCLASLGPALSTNPHCLAPFVESARTGPKLPYIGTGAILGIIIDRWQVRQPALATGPRIWLLFWVVFQVKQKNQLFSPPTFFWWDDFYRRTPVLIGKHGAGWEAGKLIMIAIR